MRKDGSDIDIAALIKVVRGEEPAELLLKNARVINVFSGKIEETSIAIVQSGSVIKPCLINCVLLADAVLIVMHHASQGLDPIIAIQIVTLNAAEYFGLHDRGAIAPGRRADLVVFDNFESFKIEQVYQGGRLVARHGRISPQEQSPHPPPVRNSISVKSNDTRQRAMSAWAWCVDSNSSAARLGRASRMSPTTLLWQEQTTTT